MKPVLLTLEITRLLNDGVFVNFFRQ